MTKTLKHFGLHGSTFSSGEGIDDLDEPVDGVKQTTAHQIFLGQGQLVETVNATGTRQTYGTSQERIDIVQL